MLTPPPATLALGRRIGRRIGRFALRTVRRGLGRGRRDDDARSRGRRLCPKLSIDPESWRLLIDTINHARARGTGVALLVAPAHWRVAVEALDLWAGPIDLVVDPDHLEPEEAVPEAPPPLRGGLLQTADLALLVDRLRDGLHLAAVDESAADRLREAAERASAPVVEVSVDDARRLVVAPRQKASDLRK